MPHETSLISTVALSLIAALIGALVATRLRLPLLVGYLLGGVLIGPFTSRLIADAHVAQELAEAGVIQLMFGVGLHFSVRELFMARTLAVPGALLQMAVATCLGAALAFGWGWSPGEGLVFGLALSVASTVVLLRALQTQGTLSSEAGRIAVGWLIVEDLIMVLILVLLPAFAGVLGGEAPGHGSAPQGSHLGSVLVIMGMTLTKVAAFLAVMLLAGKRLLRWVLKRVEQVGSDELLVAALGAIALGVAYCSVKLFGVSFALGAFVAGLVLNESDLGKAATKHLHTLENALVVLFFVAVGMLFDPRILVQEPLRVLAVVAVIIIGKSIAAFALVLVFRRTVPIALTIAASLAQIGEFSFILAGLGISLRLLPPEGLNLIVAGALFSIAINPLIFGLVRTLERRTRVPVAEGHAASAQT
ncbi:MAG TPA: cation:proton antiporter [Chthoniobacterales bacterium]|nr:cation:proton antiporter [Chthoniobacterales bacterium]